MLQTCAVLHSEPTGSHMFPRPKCCPTESNVEVSPGYDSEVLSFSAHIDGIISRRQYINEHNQLIIKHQGFDW